ncbi:MAG: hypothetical protein JHC31_06850 [Sulfurihydrogenibium sp.]|jgi:hypothetical protein|nr:hypothetical protein [Sulfurihydrogenibium sp.]
MQLRSPALSILLLIFLFLGGAFYSSKAGQINIDVPGSVRAELGKEMYDEYNQFLSQVVDWGEKTGYIEEARRKVEQGLEALKDSRVVLSTGLLTRSNLYMLGLTLVGSVAIDYLSKYAESYFDALESQSVAPPSQCKFLPYQCPSKEQPATIPPTLTPDSINEMNYYTIVNWTVYPDGTCYPVFSGVKTSAPMKETEIVSKFVWNQAFMKYFPVGQSPEAYLPPKCDPPLPKPQSQTQTLPPPLPPLDDFLKQIPQDDIKRTLTFQDSPNMKTPDDIPYMSSGDVVVAPAQTSPDGTFSPDLTTPVPDFAVPGAKIEITINNKTYTDNGTPIQQPNQNPNQDYTYTPADANLDTNIDIPQKKDLRDLIMSNIEAIKNKFFFDSNCSGGACSFSVDIFGQTATIDFCQFADLFSVIGSIILVFAYFYAFFIIMKGG